MSDAQATGLRGWERGKGWGWVWGDDDQVGALNALDEASVLAALGTVTRGKAYDLGVLMDRGSFLSPAHIGTEVLPFRTADGLLKEGVFGDDPEGMSFQTSMIMISDHAGTQLDGLCHVTFGADKHWYNGYTVGEHHTDFGTTRAGGENIPPIIASGVLIDVAGHLGLDECEPGYAITVEDLEGALSRQGVDIEPGEVVLIRTGAMRNWGADGHEHDKIAGPDTAGLSLASARWLVEEKGAVVVGSDTSTVEVVPPVDGDLAAPVHKYLLVDQGVHMGELHYLEDIAADGVYRFCYIALCPKVRGTTAGFALRPIALV